MESLGEILSFKNVRYKTDRLKNKDKWLEEGTTWAPNIFLLDSDFSIQARMLMMIIALHSFNSNKCFPPNWMLCIETGLSEPQIIKYKDELRGEGLISITRTGRSNVYEIDWNAVNDRVEKIIRRLKIAKKAYQENWERKRAQKATTEPVLK